MWTSVIEAYKIFQKFVPCTWSVMLIFPKFTWPKRSYYLKWKVIGMMRLHCIGGKIVLGSLCWNGSWRHRCTLCYYWILIYRMDHSHLEMCPFLVSLYSSSAFQYCLVDTLAMESFPNNLPFYKEKEARR